MWQSDTTTLYNLSSYSPTGPVVAMIGETEDPNDEFS